MKSSSHEELDNFAPVGATSSFGVLSRISAFDPFATHGRAHSRKPILGSQASYHRPQPEAGAELNVRVKRMQGWRLGTLVSCFAVATCLVLELALLIYSIRTNRPRGGLGMLYDGSCAKVKKLSILVLLPLNIIGTVLISTSNYVMQAVAAPTRLEVNQSHVRGGFRNIGMPTSYDMVNGRPYKSTLWWILALTTMPIHLFLNSSVFSTLQTNNYGVMIVSSDFEQDETWKLCNTTKVGNYTSSFVCEMRQLLAERHSAASNITSLSSRDCISRYGNDLQSSASSVALLTDSSIDYSILEDMQRRHHIATQFRRYYCQ